MGPLVLVVISLLIPLCINNELKIFKIKINPEIITELSKNYEIKYYSGKKKKEKNIFLKSTVRLKDRDCHGTPADAELTEGSDAGAEIPAGGASGRFPHHSGGGVGPLQLGGGHLWPSKHTL